MQNEVDRDNFIVFGKDNTDHDKALENLFHLFRESAKFRLPQIEFFGFIFSINGIKPQSRWIHPETYLKCVLSWAWPAQYSARFVPNFAETSTPLRSLTHQGTKWQWSQTEQAAFEKLKDTLSNDGVLDTMKLVRT